MKRENDFRLLPEETGKWLQKEKEKGDRLWDRHAGFAGFMFYRVLQTATAVITKRARPKQMR